MATNGSVVVKRVLNEDGFDITEGVQVILDALENWLGIGSGSLDYREGCAVRQVIWAMGLDLNKFGLDTERHEVFEKWYPYRRRYVEWPDPSAPLTDEPPPEERVTFPGPEPQDRDPRLP